MEPQTETAGFFPAVDKLQQTKTAQATLFSRIKWPTAVLEAGTV